LILTFQPAQLIFAYFKLSNKYPNLFFGRADFTASASLQGICGGEPQPHTLCLASAANSIRE
jgi:hypothetical protein